jgi:hypothetical protein
MQTLRSLACSLAVAGTIALSTGCIISDDGPDATLTVFNDSDFVIIELNLVRSFSGTWGPDLLGGNDLFPDESITLGVDCDFYDARLIDEDGVECQVLDIDLCLNDADWVIRNNTCTVFGVAKAEREAAKKAATQAQPSDAASNATL